MADKQATGTSQAEVAERDRQWRDEVYRGGREREFTIRTVILGAVIGTILSLSNLYVGFKTGWSLGVTITAAIMAYAVFKAVRTLMPFFFRNDLTILENNILQTMAAACADTASAGLVSAIPALMMVTGTTLAPWKLTLWIMTILMLGVFMAVPMKRQMINVEQLRFPTGTATSEVLKGIHETGIEALRKARALFAAMGIGLVIAWCRDGVIGFPRFIHGHIAKSWGTWEWKRLLPPIPATFVPSSWSVFSIPFAKLGIAFEGSLIMVGAGAIMGIRVGLSLIFATILGWGVLAPVMIHRGDIDHPAPRVTAADGFTQNARLFSDRELYFPVTVPSGAALSLQVRFNDGPPLTLVRRWEKTATYASAASLARGLNRAALPDGRANPFAGKIAFGVDSQKNHLYATFAQSPGTGAVLSVSAGRAAEALGFKPGSSAEVLRFPMAIPVGTHLAFSVGMVDGPRGKMAEKRYALNFQQNVTVRGRESLLALLNGAATPWGAPNPLHGVVSFTWVRGHLAAEAARARQWDSQLTVDDSAGNRLLGFAPGQTRREDYGGYRNIVHWLMWPGVAMMVTAGLLSFFYQWKTVVRALSGLARVFRPKKDREAEEDPVSGIEVPGTWFAVGFLLTGALAVILQISFFGIHWWMAVLAVLMTFLLAIVACRATGETDITPVGPLGKITQLMYGAIAPGNMTTNIMTANVTGGAAASSGDLLQALKCGYLVGASPRKQYISMLLGVGVGALVSVPVYHLLVPTPAVLGTDQLPAPAAQVWAGVALLLSHGFAALPVSARWALLIGGLLGIVITVCEKHVPGARKFLPSPTGMGIALVIPAFNCVSMFLGALAAWLFEKRSKAAADRYTIPVASGIIAGESLMGILVAVLKAFHFMI